MIYTALWVFAIILVSFVAYFLSYIRFRRTIALQTRQMIQLMKAEDVEQMQVGNIYLQTDEDFSDLERAAMSLRKKYLRLRKQSKDERKGYETVFSGLNEAIVTVDQNLKIISFNSAFMKVFKWAPNQVTPHYFLHDVIRDPQIMSTFKKAFLEGKVQKNEIDQDQLFVTPLPSRIENESWCLGVFYDLSEIRKTERIRIDFVANASHEIRTPLTVIKGYADLLALKLKSLNMNTELELLNPILQSTEQMSELMDELLDLSRLDVGVALVKAQLNTQEITFDVIQEIDNLLKMNNKKIFVDLKAPWVKAHAESLKQVIRNLVVNAIKYSGQAQEIFLEWSENETTTFLKVKDNGPGIPLEHQDRIFERFYRLDKGRGRDRGGSGLGLALVKHLMLNHNGQIKLISDAQNGCEFICEFPKYESKI